MKSRFVRRVAAVVIVGAVAASGWAFGTSAAAADPAPGAYTLVNAGSGLCLTVPGASGSDGVQLTQSGCGATGQTWNLTAAGGGFQVRAAHSGLCAGVKDASTSAGKAVQQENCTG
ncbi:RICIN domain-containing protein, partial [Streptosporangium sp. LJ11]|uniref:RICIN domain-containing protein n=1 Tax=Streptosporangium sp. LJ11 TaxID=3436927 RepID=UPI003F79B0B8